MSPETQFLPNKMSDWVVSNISPSSYTCVDLLGRDLLRDEEMKSGSLILFSQF